MDVRIGPRSGINSFALVSYLESPLADFVDQLRRDIAPECVARAHLTLLPPRPITRDVAEAERQLVEALADTPPIDVSLGDVAIFPQSEVIHIEVRRGLSELMDLYRYLNHGAVEFQCPFPYHPHVTLAQDLPHDAVQQHFEYACRKWDEAHLPRQFSIDRLTFVQNTLENRWMDLATIDLTSRVRS